MKKYFLTITLLAMLVILPTSCGQGGGNGENDENAAADSTETDDISLRDATLYGICDDYAMSSFTFVTNYGDTLFLTKDGEDGTAAQIHGSLDYGNSYAVTTRNGATALNVLINLTELNKFIKKYTILNGNLIVEGDTVTILELDETHFQGEGRNGKVYSYSDTNAPKENEIQHENIK